MDARTQRTALKPPISGKDEHLLTILAIAMIAGMLVALVLSGLWKYHSGALSGSVEYFALTVCPSFLLFAVLGSFDNSFALVMTIGTVVFANGFLYSGFAAGLYFVVTRFLLIRRSKP